MNQSQWTQLVFRTKMAIRGFRPYGLTLSRMMSISEYFIPLTSTGVSLNQKQTAQGSQPIRGQGKAK